MNKQDIFIELRLTESQVSAMRTLYYRYFHNFMPTVFDGRGVIALWYAGATWESGKGHDLGHNNPGIVSTECECDSLWEQEFSDLLPFMSKTATITKIQPGLKMVVHIDRLWRPVPIYFPISGCSEDCVSLYYDLPKQNTQSSQQWHGPLPPPAHTLSVNQAAVLSNAREWHSVENRSRIERIAFGWNFKDKNASFKECKDVLHRLGYIG